MLVDRLAHGIAAMLIREPLGGKVKAGFQLETVAERYRRSVTFHTCSAMGMDPDGRASISESAGKARITSGVVYPGGSPVCEQ